MPVSAVQHTKRALVSLMKALAARYGVVLHISRDSPDAEVRSAYRRTSRTVHPDRSGDGEDPTQLNAAHDAWAEALQASTGRGGRRVAGRGVGAAAVLAPIMWSSPL